MNGPTTDKFQRFPISDIESYWTITNRRLHELDLNSVLKGYKTTTCTLTRVKTQLTMLRFNGLVNRIGGQQMRANLFWFSDGQWARIEPFIPSNRRGVKPKNNRRILSGIMHVLKSGCRWVDCPPEYGPAKTVYNRFNRWSAQGIWQSIFEAVAEPAEPPERMALDSTHIKAHRCAGGGKGGRRNRRLASPRAGATARFTALSISCAARGS
jgi:mannitol 2-dehydrogenase